MIPQVGRAAGSSIVSMASGDADDTHQGNEGVGPMAPARGDGTLEVRMARPPTLAALTTLAAVLHLSIKRVVLPVWLGQGYDVPPWLAALPRFTLNLTAMAGLLCFAQAIWLLASDEEFAHAGRRMLIAVLGLFVGAVAAASLVLQEGRINARTVIMAAASAHALTVQLAMAALRQHRSLAGRTTAVLVAAASLFPLASMLTRHLMPLGPALLTRDGVTVLHGLGEITFLLVPIAAAFVVVPWSETPAGGRARGAGAVAAFIVGLLFAAASQLPEDEYGHLLYATLRLEFAIERASLGYAVPVSLAAGAATAALLSRDTRHRQGGLSLWLWLAAGYNPLSPARLLLWSLSSVLLSRALVSLRREEQSGTGATEDV